MQSCDKTGKLPCPVCGKVTTPTEFTFQVEHGGGRVRMPTVPAHPANPVAEREKAVAVSQRRYPGSTA